MTAIKAVLFHFKDSVDPAWALQVTDFILVLSHPCDTKIFLTCLYDMYYSAVKQMAKTIFHKT